MPKLANPQTRRKKMNRKDLSWGKRQLKMSLPAVLKLSGIVVRIQPVVSKTHPLERIFLALSV
jgi:hypothetical protein